MTESAENWATRMLAVAILEICANAFDLYGHCLYTWEVLPRPDYDEGCTEAESVAHAALVSAGWDDDNQGRADAALYRKAAEQLRLAPAT